jgi:hypothetical protein
VSCPATTAQDQIRGSMGIPPMESASALAGIMTDIDMQLARATMISEIVSKAPGIGRTALMKCLFFLTAVKKVPLGYNFRLYTYGPFDADVLGDVQYAEALGAIVSTIAHYPGGYAYEYKPGPQRDEIEQCSAKIFFQHSESIDWVVRTFASRSAVDLEMASTLVYVDREQADRKATISIADLARKVRDIKPHLAIKAIEREAQNLKDTGLLIAVA